MAPNALFRDVNSFVLFSRARAPHWHTLAYLYINLDAQVTRRSPRFTYVHRPKPRSLAVPSSMEASPSRSVSFSHRWLGCKAWPAQSSFERLHVDGDADLGHSCNSSASFIDMDPAELFSMRWMSAGTEEEEDFDFGLQPCAGAQYSPLLVGAGRVLSDGHLLLPSEPSIVVRDDSSTYVDVSPSSSPVFHSAQSTPAFVVGSRRAGARGSVKARAEPLLATRRILLRYLRFLVPLCRKVRALPLRVFAPRSRASLAASTSTPARRSTSSFVSAAEYWCHGNADTAVRDAILYCKKSIGQDM